MSSFDGVTIGERGSGGQSFPIWQKRGLAVVKHIPGGDVNVIQVIGFDLPRMSMPARVTAAQLTALYGKVGVSGSLVFSYETTTALLESIEGEEISAGKDTYMVTLTFVRSGGAIGAPSNALVTDLGETLITGGGDTLVY